VTPLQIQRSRYPRRDIEIMSPLLPSSKTMPLEEEGEG
jgi:hypothetical protein